MAGKTVRMQADAASEVASNASNGNVKKAGHSKPRMSLFHHVNDLNSMEDDMEAQGYSSYDSQQGKQGVWTKLCPCFKPKAPPWQQTLVIVRHSERRDRIDANYKSTPEGAAWPHDTPITEAGFKLASSVAAEIADLHAKARFGAIAVSPYRRCLETASEVAKVLNLPVVIDQEIGEVFDTAMPKEPNPFRSPTELREMCKALGLNVVNPVLDDGGFKLFGKPPVWPETLEDAKRRYVIRIENYIQQSADTRQNFVLVTHADAVAAALQLFERGFADIESMEFCARLIASRPFLKHTHNEETHGVYAEKWNVEFKGVEAAVPTAEEDQGMNKYYEKMHVENCDELQKMAAKRKDKRTKTDSMFDSALRIQAAERRQEILRKADKNVIMEGDSDSSPQASPKAEDSSPKADSCAEVIPGTVRSS